MKIGKNVKPSIPPVPGGTYMAVCIYSLGIGEQLCKYKDTTRYNNQVMIGFELVGQTVEIDGVQQPRVLGRTFNIAKSQNSGLRKFLGSWLGKSLTDDEYMGFDTNSLLGKAAMLNVVLNDTGEYANIDSIMGLPVGMPVPEATTTPYWFDMDDGFDQAAFEKLPEWAQEKIKKSTQWQKEFAPKTEVKVDAGTGEVLSSALPDTAPDAAQGTGRAPF